MFRNLLDTIDDWSRGGLFCIVVFDFPIYPFSWCWEAIKERLGR